MPLALRGDVGTGAWRQELKQGTTHKRCPLAFSALWRRLAAGALLCFS